MPQKAGVKKIISSLRGHVASGTLDAIVVCDATAELAKHGYQYNSNLFPALPANHHWAIPALIAPESLAEALLWNMGKWTIYKSFVEHHVNAASAPKNTDVVFYAFAKHLKDPTRRI
jgi:hypothetical protein